MLMIKTGWKKQRGQSVTGATLNNLHEHVHPQLEVRNVCFLKFLSFFYWGIPTCFIPIQIFVVEVCS